MRISLRSLFRWMYVIAFEMIAVAFVLLLKPFRRLAARRVVAGSTRNAPVLLVHGYLHDATAWVYQQKQLARLGLGPIYTLNLEHPFRSIVDYAEQVRDKANQIEAETGKSNLILIGHSMGGLVSAWYATQLAHPSKVTDVITLGSPLSGTYLAKIGIGPNAREMERHSVFLHGLQEMIQKSSIRFFHVASTTDAIVPAASAILPTDPTRQAIFEDLGHIGMLFSPRVVRQIHTWLVH